MLCLFLDEQNKYESLKTSSEVIYVDDFSGLVNFMEQSYEVIVFASGDFVSVLNSLKEIVGDDTKVYKPESEMVPLDLNFKVFKDPESFLAELNMAKSLSKQGLDFDEKLDSEGTRNIQLQTAISQVIPSSSSDDSDVDDIDESFDDSGLDIRMPDLGGSVDEKVHEEIGDVSEIQDVTLGDIALDDVGIDDISLAADGDQIDNAQNVDDDSIDLGEVGDGLDFAKEDDIEQINNSESMDNSMDLGESVGDLDLAEDSDIEELNASAEELDDSIDLDKSSEEVSINVNGSDDDFNEDTGKTLIGDINELSASNEGEVESDEDSQLSDEVNEFDEDTISTGLDDFDSLSADGVDELDDLDDIDGLDELGQELNSNLDDNLDDDIGGDLDSLSDSLEALEGDLGSLDVSFEEESKTLISSIDDIKASGESLDSADDEDDEDDDFEEATIIGGADQLAAFKAQNETAETDDEFEEATIVGGFKPEELEGANSSSDENILDDYLDEVKNDAQRLSRLKEQSKKESYSSGESALISSLSANELLDLKVTIGELKDDRERLLQRIDHLDKENLGLKQSTLNHKADNDELKIEISILKKRHIAELEELRHKLAVAEQRREVLEVKNKSFINELDRIGSETRIDSHKTRQREKELENKLEMLTIDSDSKVKSRDMKILELKRKIDSLEFNMENLSIREKQTKKDKRYLEDKLSRVIGTLRNSLNVLEEEVDIDDIREDLDL